MARTATKERGSNLSGLKALVWEQVYCIGCGKRPKDPFWLYFCSKTCAGILTYRLVEAGMTGEHATAMRGLGYCPYCGAGDCAWEHETGGAP